MEAITNLTLTELSKAIRSLGKESYRSRQVFQWLYQKQVADFSEMTNVSKELRGFLSDHYTIPSLELSNMQISPLDGTKKFLWRLSDNETIESVLIPGNERTTLCISSQVGCAMKCSFCNTGDMGLKRNLAVHEIVDQVLEICKRLNRGEVHMPYPLTNIVFMGMGEPLHNVHNVCKAINILLDDNGLKFSQRKITVSTSGLVKQMKILGEKTKINLAVSLNATTNEFRNKIMPVNKKYPLEDLLKACKEYPLGKKRRITFEYVIFKGLNDSMDDAKRILKLLSNIPSKVNLIPYNPHPASEYLRPDLKEVYKMQKYLLDKGMNTTVRISKGIDILAACGQLRSLAKQKAS